MQKFPLRSISGAHHVTRASTPLLEGGCAVGALAGYPVGHYLGRKWGLFATALVFTVGAVLQCVASGKTGLGIMYAGRFIAGMGVGTASNLTVSLRMRPDESLRHALISSSILVAYLCRRNCASCYPRSIDWNLRGWLANRSSRRFLDQLRNRSDYSLQQQAMAHLLRCSTHPRWYARYLCYLLDRVSSMA